MAENILVTGGAGFIGSWLCKVLSESGKSVIAFDDLSTGELANLDGMQGVEFVQGDICNIDQLSKLPWSSITACYHLAAKGDVQESIDNPWLYTQVNIIGTQNILEFCRKTLIPTLFMSTCMVYGFDHSKDSGAINEEFPSLPLSPYGASKLSGEQLAISYHHSYGLPLKIARPFNT